MKTKKFWKSKTVIIAFIQGVIGVIIAVQSSIPDIKTVGVLALVKSALDVAIRLISNTEIEI